MKKISYFVHQNIKKFQYLLFILLAIASLYQSHSLRKIGFNVTPEPGVILDEYTNIWHGLSIRESGLPVAWSQLDAYKSHAYESGSGGDLEKFGIRIGDNRLNIRNFRLFPSPILIIKEINVTEHMSFGRGAKYVWFIEPYLDHPPLGAIIMSLGVPRGIKSFLDLSSFDMRRASLFVALITQLLLLIFSYQLTKNLLISLFSSFIFATVPSYILLTRYALLENVLTPLILLMLVILGWIRDAKSKYVIKNPKLVNFLLIIAGLVSGFAALTKIAGWITLPLGVFLMIVWRFKKKQILSFVIPSVIVGSLYFLWGLYLSPKLFMDLIIYQGITRGFIGSINLLVTAVKVNILNFPFDGWWVGGFVTLLLLPKSSKYLALYSAVILVLLSALVIGGANYPWYFIPLIPFACVSVAIFIYNIAIKPGFISIMTLFFIFVSSSFYWGYGVFQAALLENNFQQPFLIYRILFILFLSVSLLWKYWEGMKRFKKQWFAVVITLFIVLILLNHRSIYFILENWGKLPLLYTPGTF